VAASYTVKMAALATGVQQKWLDNLLSHHSLPGVSGGRQGLERSISIQGILGIELVRLATLDLGIPIARAVAIATELLSSGSRGRTIRTASGVQLRFPIEEIERRLRERLVEAVEAAPSLPRGRPRSGQNENAER
jgi:hypothetical protein